MNFPKDEDGEVLELLYKSGVDFNQKHVVDFFVAVPNQKLGEELLIQLKGKEFDCELEQDEETKEWTCFCSKEMFLKYDEIIEVQKRLDELSKPYGGYTDGWATFGD
ncbi:ribonuclease E inhibitor RraB [Peribacillus phoenicis]|uniref:ribonuclease E inhibitor RraB n=1 Tax=unclassified Peribacillus TaxID=2675266 RepID=UPI0039A304FA